METRFCDWHTHLNFSKDCPLSIEEYFRERLPRVIRDIPLAGVSITDHNTIDAYTVGKAEAHLRQMNNRLSTQVKLLLGTELSLDVAAGGHKQHVHFLFYHPNTKGGLEKTAEWLQQGLLGDIMARIRTQNNERHRIMAKKAANYLDLKEEDTKALHSIIEMERGLSREIGREHVKRALTILFPSLNERIHTMLSRPGGKNDSSCYVATEEVKGLDVPYLPTLEALAQEYRMGMVVMAHPWRYDAGFEFADRNKAKEGILIDMSRFVPYLAERRLIKGIEIYGYYPIPNYLRSMDREDLLENNVPRNIVDSVRRPVRLDRDTGRQFRVKHVRYTGTTYRMMAIENDLICTGGNDSHGEELPGGKPDIPIGYGCRETDPLPYHMTGVRHTPARPIPALGSMTR